MKNHPLRSRCLCTLVLLLFLPLWGSAQASGPVEIRTPEELLAIKDDPSGEYILMEDLDMSGVEWVGPDFSGIFDGNGHAILNLSVSAPGETVKNTCDGNQRLYKSVFAGLFSTLDHATVKDLSLINIRALVDTDQPCFLGGIAGYSKNSTIDRCTVTGTLELRAFDRMFGIGGLVGFGSGHVDGCTAEVTLISVDTKEDKDEMFLGGVCAMGFFDITNSSVVIDGYASEYGYAHCGGLMGMMMRYPIGNWTSIVSGNEVSGKITFFERVSSRRAYCEPFIGEQMTTYCKMSGNTQEFLRDERTEYVELRPETCEAPAYTQTVTAPVCNAFGYTTYTCGGCGYAYNDHYTRYGDHQVTQWQVTQASTLESEGVSTGLCDLCGAELQRSEPRLEPPAATEAPTTPPTEAPSALPSEPSEPVISGDDLDVQIQSWVWWAVGGLLAILALVAFRPRYKGAYVRKK